MLEKSQQKRLWMAHGNRLTAQHKKLLSPLIGQVGDTRVFTRVC